MSNNTTAILTFTAADSLESDKHEVIFKGARPSKATVVELGSLYYSAAAEGSDKHMDNLLNTYGPVQVRRALLAFSNVTGRMGHKDVAAAAKVLRAEIKVLPVAKTA